VIIPALIGLEQSSLLAAQAYPFDSFSNLR